MAPYKNKDIYFILIQNNIIIGTRIGIYFFDEDSGGSYGDIGILFNTLWNIDYTPIFFPKIEEDGDEDEEEDEDEDSAHIIVMKNNFIYFDSVVRFESKNLGDFYSNYFYNTPVVPSIYSNSRDQDSKAVEKIPLDSIFNKISGCENYYDPNLNPECLRPSLEPGIMKLYHSGISLHKEDLDDIYSCNRNIDTPSIGAFEYPVGCSGVEEPTEPTDNPLKDYDIRFNITFCTSDNRVLKILGSYCYWTSQKCITMTKDANCTWTATIQNGEYLNFLYKFAETKFGQKNATTIYNIESSPNRIFDGEKLLKHIAKNATGIYEDCKYSISGNLITLVCSWR